MSEWAPPSFLVFDKLRRGENTEFLGSAQLNSARHEYSLYLSPSLEDLEDQFISCTLSSDGAAAQRCGGLQSTALQ